MSRRFSSRQGRDGADASGRHCRRRLAGLFAARALRRSPVRVTILDRAGHHLFQPLLYQCATGILSKGQIAAPLRQFVKRLRNGIPA